MFFFFFSSRRRHTRSLRDWSSDVCSSDLDQLADIRFVIALLRQRAGAGIDREREADGVQRLGHQMTATASAPSLTLNDADVSSVFPACATWLTCVASSFTSVPFIVMREPVFVSMTISPCSSSMRIVKLSVLKNLIDGAASAASICPHAQKQPLQMG